MDLGAVQMVGLARLLCLFDRSLESEVTLQ